MKKIVLCSVDPKQILYSVDTLVFLRWWEGSLSHYGSCVAKKPKDTFIFWRVQKLPKVFLAVTACWSFPCTLKKQS